MNGLTLLRKVFAPEVLIEPPLHQIDVTLLVGSPRGPRQRPQLFQLSRSTRCVVSIENEEARVIRNAIPPVCLEHGPKKLILSGGHYGGACASGRDVCDDALNHV